MRLHRNEIRGCYQRELIRDPGAAGRLDLTFTIDADGWTDQIETSSPEIRSEAFAQCIKHRVTLWRFPEIDAGRGPKVLVRQHYLFAASQGGMPQP
jgi:hypothetical protein